MDGYNGYLDLNRLMGRKSLEFFTENNDDINEVDTSRPSSWANDAWKWGIKEGITDGERPKKNATREEIITMLYRFKEKI